MTQDFSVEFCCDHSKPNGAAALFFLENERLRTLNRQLFEDAVHNLQQMQTLVDMAQHNVCQSEALVSGAQYQFWILSVLLGLSIFAAALQLHQLFHNKSV